MKVQMSRWKHYLHQRALEVGLTSQQKEIFVLIFGERKSRQDVSKLLNISANACQQCLGEIYSKFEIFSRSRGKEKELYVKLRRDFQGELSQGDSMLEPLHLDSEDYNGEWNGESMTSQFKFEEAFQWIEQKLVAQGERLKEVDRLILRGAWDRVSYKKLAEESKLSLGYIQSDAGASLWKLLSQVLNADVTKRNLRTVVEGQMQQQLYPSEFFHLPSEESIAPDMDRIFDGNRDSPRRAVDDLETFVLRYNPPVLTKLEDTHNTMSNKIKAIWPPDTEQWETVVDLLYNQGFQHFQDSQFDLPQLEETKHKLRIAEFYFRLVLQLHPDYILAFYSLGETYLNLGDYKNSNSYFHKAKRYKSMEPWALNYLGYLAIQEENFTKAEHILIQALQSIKKGEADLNSDVLGLLANPDDIRYLKSAILKNLGWAVFRQGQIHRYPEAEAKLEASIVLDPEYAPPYCLLAQVKEALHKPAPSEWKKCLALASPCRGVEEGEWIKLATERIVSEEV